MKVEELLNLLSELIKEEGIDIDNDDFDLEHDTKKNILLLTTGDKNIKIKITGNFNQHD